MDNLTIVEGAGDAEIARWIAGVLAGALASGGPVAFTVPGGASPFPIFERLAGEPLDWRRLAVWPNDDRAVPEQHPASNTGRIRAIFAPAGAQVVSLSEMEQVPRFALAWLGMGEDGHVASLFPSANPRVDDPQAIRRLTPHPLPPEAPFARITLTLPALLASERLLLVIRGAAKRAVFEAAAAGASDSPIARLLAGARQPVTCFV
ncbi:MAG: 6-phosphogluconolactonase [Cypionkella sp.]